MWYVEVRVKEHMAEDWAEWFDKLSITYVDDDTILTGAILDQSALYGLFAKLRDLGLSLVSLSLSLRPSSPQPIELTPTA